MRLRVTVALPVVIGLSLIAIQAGRQWLNRQVAERMRGLESSVKVDDRPAIALGTLVVAAEPLHFGSALTPASLRVTAWPSKDIPAGGFARVGDVFKGGATRVALAEIDPGEPLLEDRISGPGRSASLAALIRTGMRAITVRVDEVIGVAGFVAPGDRVDVLLTHRTGDAQPVSDVVQQDLKVLAVDQTVDNPTAKPTVARAVTLEVNTEEAQKLALAESVGSLTLVLRPIDGGARGRDGRITLSDLNSSVSASRASDERTVTVSVIRDSQRHDYSVPAAD